MVTDRSGFAKLAGSQQTSQGFEEIQLTLSAGLDEGSSGLNGQKVTSQPCSFLQIDRLPVNRFSGSVLEQVNPAIFEAF